VRPHGVSLRLPQVIACVVLVGSGVAVFQQSFGIGELAIVKDSHLGTSSPDCVPCPLTGSCIPPQDCDRIGSTKGVYLGVFLQNNTTGGPVDVAEISINGSAQTTAADGTPYTFSLNWAYDIDIKNIVKYVCNPYCYPYAFERWVTNAGTLGSPTSASTTFKATTSATGDWLVAVMEIEATWSGYVESGTHVTAVQAEFNVISPTYTSGVTNGCQAEENVASWVGIGGNAGAGGLWQAGIVYNSVQSGGSYSFVASPFIEYAATYLPFTNTNVSLSSAHTYSVSAYISGSQLSFDFYDMTTSSTIWSGTWAGTTGTGSGYYPDMTTAEWVMEAGQIVPCLGGSQSVTPTFSTGQSFSDPEWTDSSNVYSLYLNTAGEMYNAVQWDVGTSVCSSGHLDQSMTPGGWGSTYATFTVGYTQSCT
jgi:hypothetical protein